MPSINRIRPQPDNRIAFLTGFLRRPKEVGSIIPSSRFLERRVVRCARPQDARVVVELGPGTGGTTRAMLRAMAPETKLMALEVNPRFAELLAREPDPRLHVHQQSAEDIQKVLALHGESHADLVLSGIPFSTMPRRLGLSIMRSVLASLRPGGAFVAYQVRDRVELLAREVFGPAEVLQLEIRNLPPMRVYRWLKHEPS